MTKEPRKNCRQINSSSARWGAAVLVGVLFAAPAAGQDAAREQALMLEKSARAADLQRQQPMVNQLLPPGASTTTRPYLRLEIHQGGLYEPSLFPTETWLQVACIHDDLQTGYDRTKHGSSLFKIHAIVYNADLDEIHNTIDTTAGDEAICSVSFPVDSSFIELSRTDGRRVSTAIEN